LPGGPGGATPTHSASPLTFGVATADAIDKDKERQAGANPFDCNDLGPFDQLSQDPGIASEAQAVQQPVSLPALGSHSHSVPARVGSSKYWVAPAVGSSARAKSASAVPSSVPNLGPIATSLYPGSKAGVFASQASSSRYVQLHGISDHAIQRRTSNLSNPQFVPHSGHDGFYLMAESQQDTQEEHAHCTWYWLGRAGPSLPSATSLGGRA
jgi:hypothetical protein